MRYSFFMAEQPARQILSVSELNQSTRQLLEGTFALIWVEGELSNVSQPASRHLYFTLKDSHAQVRAVMFRNRNLHLRFKPAPGVQVLTRARVSLYEPRGDYQLIIEHMEEAGEGALRRAFDELRIKLSAEGLFDDARKRLLPKYPSCVGIITSTTGAAIRDLLIVLKRRFPAIPIVVYPVTVQGRDAASSITSALVQANSHPVCDVLILSRGGGSLEDLQAFNEEAVARAITASKIPVISAVGHETDFTIADFSADVRAATPSAAAEMVSPDAAELSARLDHHANRLLAVIERRLKTTDNQIILLSERLSRTHPVKQLQRFEQRLDELEGRLHRSIRSHLHNIESKFKASRLQLQANSPEKKIALCASRLARARQSMVTAYNYYFTHKREHFINVAHTLEAVSPLATLKRGYAILLDNDGGAIRDVKQAPPESLIEARLEKGSLFCRVLSISSFDDTDN